MLYILIIINTILILIDRTHDNMYSNILYHNNFNNDDDELYTNILYNNNFIN
jgi:hypothetical protein